MNFSVSKSLEVLERTPGVLHSMLYHISPEWSTRNEGGESWSPYDIIGHLIHGEKTDWVTRASIILSDGADKTFEKFDRLAQFEDSKNKSLEQLLDEFKTLREKNIEWIRSRNISDADLLKTGTHPAFGEVTLSQLLATWVAHDLNHIAQIARVMAKQYKEDAGPWVEYLRILQS